jgi:hypothetical protein
MSILHPLLCGFLVPCFPSTLPRWRRRPAYHLAHFLRPMRLSAVYLRVCSVFCKQMHAQQTWFSMVVIANAPQSAPARMRLDHCWRAWYDFESEHIQVHTLSRRRGRVALPPPPGRTHQRLQVCLARSRAKTTSESLPQRLRGGWCRSVWKRGTARYCRR